MQEYIVQQGDNLSKIAKQFGLDSWRKIWNANKDTIKDPNKIETGQKINIPSTGGGMPFQDEEEFDQVSYEEKIKEFFGHRIAMIKFPNVKKAKRKVKELFDELITAAQQQEMSRGDIAQFKAGDIMLKKLSVSLGGKYGAESSIERYLDKSEVRPYTVVVQKDNPRTPENERVNHTITKADYQFFADCWASTAMRHYGYTGNETSITGMPMKETTSSAKAKALHEYILNHEEKFEETPFGQIVADEVNYVVNNLPEIQLAREVLGEQEAVAAGTEIAQTLLTKLRQEMAALIPGLVKQEVEKMQADLADETQKAVASIETEEPAV